MTGTIRQTTRSGSGGSVQSAALTGVISKTLAPSGGDFSTLVEVFDWLNDTNFKDASITINVSNGTYEKPQDTELTLRDPIGIYSLSFMGESRANTIFQFNDTENFHRGIYITGIEWMGFNSIQFKSVSSITNEFMLDLAFGHAFVDQCDFVDTNQYGLGLGSNTTGEIYGCTFTGKAGKANRLINLNLVTLVYIWDVDIDGIDDNASGIRMLGGGHASVTSDLNITNCTNGIFALWGAHVALRGSYSFTSNTNDTNVPLNARQADGTLIQDTDYVDFVGMASINVQSGTSYTIQASDAGKIIIFTNAAAISVTLPDDLANNFQFTVVQAGAGVPTVTRSGSDTINGASAGVAPSAQWKGAYFTQYASGSWLALL